MHPWDMSLFVAAAIVVAVVNRKALLEPQRKTVTAILAPADERDNTRNDAMLTDRSRVTEQAAPAGT